MRDLVDELHDKAERLTRERDALAAELAETKQHVASMTGFDGPVDEALQQYSLAAGEKIAAERERADALAAENKRLREQLDAAAKLLSEMLKYRDDEHIRDRARRWLEENDDAD